METRSHPAGLVQTFRAPEVVDDDDVASWSGSDSVEEMTADQIVAGPISDVIVVADSVAHEVVQLGHREPPVACSVAGDAVIDLTSPPRTASPDLDTANPTASSIEVRDADMPFQTVANFSPLASPKSPPYYVQSSPVLLAGDEDLEA